MTRDRARLRIQTAHLSHPPHATMTVALRADKERRPHGPPTDEAFLVAIGLPAFTMFVLCGPECYPLSF